MKSEAGVGITPRKVANNLRHFFRAGAACGVANHNAAHLLSRALLRHLVKVVQALLLEIGVAWVAVFAPAARGIHGVFQINNHFKAIVLQARDGFVRHEQVLFRRRLQREHHIQQPRFHHQHCDRNTLLVAENDLHVGPLAHLGSAPARSAKERQLHRLGVNGVESGRQVADKLVGAGKTDFGIVHAEGPHALKKA